MPVLKLLYCFIFLVVCPSLSIADPVPEYVGDQACKACHLKQHQQWQGSHHELAMQEASNNTVLGNFNTSRFTKGHISSTFFKEKQQFMVNTDGPDGKLHDYEISYTFGVYPLQQYMVKFPQGKIQVLDIAWDSRPKQEGGQRWFSLHPDQTIKAGDVLHWTGPNLNWNYMCADCHSTHLKKNYSASNRTYKTTWQAINVSCEACHGPAAEHVIWATTEHKETAAANGLTIHLTAASKQWKINDKTGKPEHPGKTARNNNEIEVCAKCHSRRSQLDDEFIPGDHFRDHYLPALLTEPLYYPDGKINDEVYVYGSFIQSRMYQAGVTCSDCHNPHTLARKAPGDKVCQQCHRAEKYATPTHHWHPQNTEGASCIACHMPAKTYMGVDQRNDHSFRIPRPDLSESLSMPNACNNCHQDKDKQWATTAMQKWSSKGPQGYQQFGPALHALTWQKKDALSLAYAVLTSAAPDIAKATVTGFLGVYPTRQTLLTALQMLRAKDADTRRQALQALAGFPPEHTAANIFAALNDPVKSVRLEAARILAAVPRGALHEAQNQLLNDVTEAYRQSLLFASDRPEAQLSLAQLYQQQGQTEKAEAAFKEALFLQVQFVPAYVNYANFLQQKNQEKAAFTVLQNGLKQVENAALYHSLGLWYVRHQQLKKAISLLQKAATLEPDNARFQYVYAVAIGTKQPAKAIAVLQTALHKHSGDRTLLTALASYYQQLGDQKNAKKYQAAAEAVLRIRP